MILADTNIIIKLWKTNDADIRKVFENEDVCICGVVRAELLHGAVSPENMENISQKLDKLREVNISDDQWDKFGRFLYKLRMEGLNLPFQDALIAYTAIYNNCTVWTNDRHFRLIREIEPLLILKE